MTSAQTAATERFLHYFPDVEKALKNRLHLRPDDRTPVSALIKQFAALNPLWSERLGRLCTYTQLRNILTHQRSAQAQIKHRESAAIVHEIRELMRLLQKDGKVGIYVSSGGFTSDARIAARSSHAHIELIDLGRFLALWQDFYSKMDQADRSLLPFKPIFFLAPAD